MPQLTQAAAIRAKNLPKTAMVFAAGLGTRMRPLSDSIPKPLVEVAGKALIDHCLDLFMEAGVETAVVNVHYRADQIEDHLRRRTAPRIVISDERALLLDQGGGIRKALPQLGSAPFFLCNTDAFWIEGAASNLTRLADAWNPEIMDALLLVAAVADSVGVDWQGDFHMDADGRLTRRDERGVAPFVYSGVAIVKPQPFEQDTREVFRLAPFLFDAAEKGRLFGLRLDGTWLHVGTPAAVGEAEAAIAQLKK
jgi:N-acetyl-alpha-D-muramate 1-phosphate uridylyltransferase